MILPNEMVQQIIPEIWHDINILGIAPQYMISVYGRVYNSQTGNYLPQNVYYDKDKYITISLKMADGSSKFFQIHRLMMLVYAPIYNDELYEVNHKDGVKYHNWLWNLEWATPSQNVQHAIKNDLFILGEDRENSILSNQTVRTICKLISDGKTNSEIISLVQFPTNCNPVKILTNIRGGLSWKHISSQYDFSNMYRKSPLFNEQQIRTMCSYMQSYGANRSTKDILLSIGIDIDSINPSIKAKYIQTISYMRKKKMYTNITSEYNY